MKHIVDFSLDYNCVLIVRDNTSAINLTTNLVQHSRTKRIRIKHHFVCDYFGRGDVSVDFVCSNDQIANIFTKALAEK